MAAAFCLPSAGQDGGSPSPDFESFGIISERNIFDPSRSARVVRAEQVETEPELVVESFTLAGTMSYEKGKYAVFQGSRPEYKKVLKPADTIAGYTIREISGNAVKLETNGTAVDLRVGMRMKRQGEGEWEAAAAPAAPGNQSGARAPAGAKAEAAPSAEESDILKRLMQKRQEEMEK